jgi:hypothetical protein
MERNSGYDARECKADAASRLPLERDRKPGNPGVASAIWPAPETRLQALVNIKHNTVNCHADEVFLL